MSFLPSFSSLGAHSTSSAPSSSKINFKPASLSYFTIFCPALKPPKTESKTRQDAASDADKGNLEAQDEDARKNARESTQILFYTSRARAALKDRMLRQIGVAKGMIEFCSMVHPNRARASSYGHDGDKGRVWNMHSSKRRMVLIEVESGIWVHASIDLPYTSRISASGEARSKVAKEYHDALLPDAWVEESIRRAWRDWVLLNGCLAHILSQKAGRARLERSLEKYFSVWAWSWDLELATNADVAQQRSLFTECINGFPVVAKGPRSQLLQLMQTEAAEKMRRGSRGERDVVVLSDTSVLWPPTDAGCFDSEDEAADGGTSGNGLKRNRSSTKTNSLGQGSGPMDPETKAELLRRVVSHLTGLERERDLIRAASVSSNSDGKRRGTSGAIREKGSSNTSSKRDVRSGLLSASTSKNRVVSGPLMQQRSASASSYASSMGESSRWSNWGSVFSGIGKLSFRPGNGDTSIKSEATEGRVDADVSQISIVTSNASGVDPRILPSSSAESPQASSPIEAPKTNTEADHAGEGPESTSPLQVFQPIQEAGEKMWNGAELAFRGIGASLGLASASAPADAVLTQASICGPSATSRLTQDGDESGQFADATIDVSGADDNGVTKVSILEPEVDVSELAEALGAEDPNLSLDVPMPSTAAAPIASTAVDTSGQPVAHFESPTIDTKMPLEVRSPKNDLISPISDTHTSDAASIRTSASAKAFPSISVTSAAWYNTKGLRSEAAVMTASPKLPSAASIFTEQRDTTEAFDVSLGGISVQSEHHDFELDGWGHETPSPFQTFRCLVGDSEVPVSYESLEVLQESPWKCDEFRVSFTTRRLLTVVIIEKVSTSKEGGDNGLEGVLEDAWQVLRRTQRILNDYERHKKATKAEEGADMRFLHLDGTTLTFQSSLEGSAEQKLEEDVQVVAEAHCVGAMELMKKHGVTETFSRSSDGKVWTASRLGKIEEGERANQTYMVLAGKKISIVDADMELRKLANAYPTFGI